MWASERRSNGCSTDWKNLKEVDLTGTILRGANLNHIDLMAGDWLAQLGNGVVACSQMAHAVVGCHRIAEPRRSRNLYGCYSQDDRILAV